MVDRNGVDGLAIAREGALASVVLLEHSQGLD